MKQIDYFVDASTGRLVTSTGASQGQVPEWVRGDHYSIRLRFLNGEEPAPLLEPVSYRFGAKPQKRYRVPFLVFSDNNSFAAEAGTGTLTFTVNLNTTLLDNLLNPGDSDGKDDETINTEVEMIDVDGNVSTIAKFRVKILNDVINGNEGVPDPAMPDYVSSDDFKAMLREVTHPTEGSYKIEDGKLYLWDIDLEQFSPVGLNENGLAVLEDS